MSWSSHLISLATPTHDPAAALVDAPQAVAAATLLEALLGVKTFGFFCEAAQESAQGSHSCLVWTSVERS